MPVFQKRCRICKRLVSHNKINRWKVCPTCAEEWQARVDKKRKLQERLDEAYDELIATGHSGNCDICGREPSTRRMSVDHNHKTGQIRGLLCYKCNYGLSWFKDDSERMQKAAEYLRRFC